MSEDEKIEEVMNRLNRLLAKQKFIEDRMKKIEDVVKEKEDKK
jgi:conjugal transfer/entry exclusion protein